MPTPRPALLAVRDRGPSLSPPSLAPGHRRERRRGARCRPPTSGRGPARRPGRRTRTRPGPGRAGHRRSRPAQTIWSTTTRRAPAPGDQHQAAHRGQRAGGLRADHRFPPRSSPAPPPRRVVLVGSGDPSLSGPTWPVATRPWRRPPGPGLRPGAGRGRRLAVPGADAGARLEVVLRHPGRVTRARARRRPAPALGHPHRRRPGLRRQAGAQGVSTSAGR